MCVCVCMCVWLDVVECLRPQAHRIVEECNRDDFARLRRLEQLCREWVNQARSDALSAANIARMEGLTAAAAAHALSQALGPLPDSMRKPASRGAARPTVNSAAGVAAWEIGEHLELLSEEPLNLVRAALFHLCVRLCC